MSADRLTMHLDQVRLRENVERLRGSEPVQRLAKNNGLADSTLRNYLAGRIEHLSLPTIIHLCNYFEVTIDDLVFGSPNKGSRNRASISTAKPWMKHITFSDNWKT